MSSEQRLAGKRALITGGTSGIGQATALRFLDEGASVVVAGRSAERGQALVTGLDPVRSSRLHFRQADVARSREVDALVEFAVERMGGLDVLVASAGVFDRGTATETDDERWQRVLDVDLSGAFYLARAGLPTLLAQGSGSIILVASELGLVGTRASVAYCAAKGGVVNLSRALAVDCAETGVRVNCLCPGPVDTPLLEHGFAQSDDPTAERAAQTAPLLVGRIGTPPEVAAAAAFLASDESSFMTGSVTVVDGGATAWYGF